MPRRQKDTSAETSSVVGFVPAARCARRVANVKRYTMVATFATCSGYPYPTREPVDGFVEQTDEQVHRRLLLLGEQRGEVLFAQDPRAGAGRGGGIRRLVEHPLDPRPQPIGGAVGIAHPPLERVHQPTAPLVEEDEHQFVLRRETTVERLGRDAGSRQDVADGRVERPGPLDQREAASTMRRISAWNPHGAPWRSVPLRGLPVAP